MQLISQSKTINFDFVSLSMQISPYNNSFIYDSKLYLKHEIGSDISKYRVFNYNNIKDGIENIFKQIITKQICFRSLFDSSTNEIHLHDIINICAAFESQFSLRNPKYNFKEQKEVKKKMINLLKESKESFSCGELEHFDYILQGFNNFNDTLKKRLEIALDEFINIYGEKNVKYGFKEDYHLLPERIKKARDALAHGNLEHPLTKSAFTDTELLRAIVYMLILQEAKIDDINIKECLQKMSRF